MPMMPSPLAAVAYGAVKLIGYAYFAKTLNRTAGRAISPYKFGVAKTAIGLAGGVAYMLVLLPAFGLRDGSDLQAFLGAIPVRLVAWSITLAIFYGFKDRPLLIITAVAAGTAWSYVLDGVMWLLYKVMPGMVMPFC